jgi:hypothetical protein
MYGICAVESVAQAPMITLPSTGYRLDLRRTGCTEPWKGVVKETHLFNIIP